MLFIRFFTDSQFDHMTAERAHKYLDIFTTSGRVRVLMSEIDYFLLKKYLLTMNIKMKSFSHLGLVKFTIKRTNRV